MRVKLFGFYENGEEVGNVFITNESLANCLTQLTIGFEGDVNSVEKIRQTFIREGKEDFEAFIEWDIGKKTKE